MRSGTAQRRVKSGCQPVDNTSVNPARSTGVAQPFELHLPELIETQPLRRILARRALRAAQTHVRSSVRDRQTV